jgi:hypothetical protein
MSSGSSGRSRSERIEQKRVADMMLTYFMSGDIDWVLDRVRAPTRYANENELWSGCTQANAEAMWRKYERYIRQVGDSIERLIDDLAAIAIEAEARHSP